MHVLFMAYFIVQTRDAVFYTTSRKSASFILMVQNLSRERNFDVDINITEGRNIFHSRCSRLPNTMHDSIPPRHSQILFLTEWSDKQRSACSFNYSYSYKHTNRESSPKPTIDRNRGDLHSPRKMFQFPIRVLFIRKKKLEIFI